MMQRIYTYKLSNHSNVFSNLVKMKVQSKYFVNMVRNTVKNAVLDLYILLKSALKMQEIPFQRPKIFREGILPDRPRILGLRPWLTT